MSVRFKCSRCGYKAITDGVTICPLCTYKDIKLPVNTGKQAVVRSNAYEVSDVSKTADNGKGVVGCLSLLVGIPVMIILLAFIEELHIDLSVFFGVLVIGFVCFIYKFVR